MIKRKSTMQTIVRYSVNGQNPATVGGLGFAAKYFSNRPGPSPTTNNSTPNANQAIAQLSVPGSNRVNGMVFNLIAAGYASVDGDGYTFQPFVVANNPPSTVLFQTTYHQFILPTAVALATPGVVYQWRLIATLFGDSSSGLLSGSYTSSIGPSNSASGATTTLTGVDFVVPNPAVGLVCGVLFGTTGVNNTASLTQFEIQA
jgi:hypothetical protein